MRKQTVNMILIVVLPSIICVAAYVLQIRITMSLQKVLKEKTQELKDAQSANKRLELLESQRQDLSQKERELNLRVSRNEKEPLSVIKELARLGASTGIMGTKFKIVKAFSDGSAPDQSAGLRSLFVEMECQATFLQLLEFIEKVEKFKRLVGVSQVKIDRTDAKLPYLKVTMQLVSYTSMSE
jgi:Tfp pilus assembly protein PilO